MNTILLAAFVLLTNSTYSVVYSTSSLIPVCTSHSLVTSDTSDAADRSLSWFRKDDRVPSALPVMYFRSGYDRGHMVPAADRSFSQEATDETFLMTNMTPQFPKTNRLSWKAVETKTRMLPRPLFVTTCAIVTNRPVRMVADSVVPDLYVKVAAGPHGVTVWVIPNSKDPDPRDQTPVLDLRNLPEL